jgi:dihydroorotate dehydrogenase
MTSPQRSFYFYIAFQKNSKIMYKQIIRPLLFLMDPEKAHSLLVSCLKGYRHLPWCRYWVRRFYAYPDKHWVWNDLVFKNRIGLSAGFDKTAEAFDELADLGFGFIEIGTVTPSPQKGNPRPRIFRLVECDSLISRTGFNNPGLDMIKLRIAQRRNSYVLGININKNPSSEGKQAIGDFLSLYRELYDTADYFTINWNSVETEVMEQALTALAAFRETRTKRVPLLLKLPADLTEEALNVVTACIDNYKIDGVIATGPTMDRTYLTASLNRLQKIGTGSISGKGIGDKSFRIVKFLRGHVGKNVLIVGAGGVMTPHDARKMLDAGADMIQIYSSLIYEGPAIVKKMIKATQ